MAILDLPDGKVNSIQVSMIPDIHFSFYLYSSHYRVVNQTWFYPKHHHPLFEINLVLEGEQIMVVDDYEYSQHHGDMLLIRPDTVHHCRVGASPQMQYLCLHFDIDDRSFISALNTSDQCFFSSNSQLIQQIFPALNKIVQHCRNGPISEPPKFLLLQSAILELFAELGSVLTVSEHNAVLFEADQQLPSVSIHRLIRKAMVYIHNEFMNYEMTLTQLAEKLKVHPNYLSGLFKSETGKTFSQYLLNLRIEQAKHLLLQTNFKIYQISERVGFIDQTYFSRLFKSVEGITPYQYREKKLGDVDEI